jgi:hypothetical protein
VTLLQVATCYCQESQLLLRKPVHEEASHMGRPKDLRTSALLFLAMLFVTAIPACAGDNPDSDNDGLTDGQEVNGLPLIEASIDPTIPANITLVRTDPLDFDTDGDGLSDGQEVFTFGTNPANPDTDGDGDPDASDPETLTFVPLDHCIMDCVNDRDDCKWLCPIDSLGCPPQSHSCWGQYYECTRYGCTLVET